MRKGPADCMNSPEHPCEPWIRPTASEGKGLSRIVREQCDVIARIPIAGDIESLNASVACGAGERKKLERLCRYVARPPLALERLDRDGRVSGAPVEEPEDALEDVYSG